MENNPGKQHSAVSDDEMKRHVEEHEDVVRIIEDFDVLLEFSPPFRRKVVEQQRSD
jgi:hypothetical protein